ncbi:hypothetical protein GW943_03050 [Candidatus Parcubacteria bacterium]|uniref:Uncharacterized protein n=1 Tax=Candidatus Kaiserbacteria bacterium CG10_big_fil_rev_8_21_14_0_10_47_16 TaxID=1974608 RepID=A0A2H0UE33_9BACT|nr:hypothetical protein [Candidatus Parcubacteria bacterium]PIR84651.1 MAG: hypothetical protein COU16_03720 [Candidatus Kaiserbacteria bacterium CG10_big_fil_rev_8_21_14_0_10_47_16]
MITKQDIIKFARTVAKREAGKVPSRTINPTREWVRGLAVAGLLFVGGMVYAGFSFSSQLHITDTQPNVEVTVPQYDQAALARTLEVYRARKESFEKVHGKSISGQYVEPATIESGTPPKAPSTGPLEAI